MSLRTRKFIGMIACVVFLSVYCLIAMALGGIYVSGANRLVQLGYFIIAGLLWMPVIMFIIRWMSPRKPES